MTNIIAPESARSSNWFAVLVRLMLSLTTWLKRRWSAKRKGSKARAIFAPLPGLTAEEVGQAWEELRTHPCLTWTPPMWRAVEDTPAARQIMQRRAISAIDANLIIEVRSVEGNDLLIRLATGALSDRPVSGGVDPVVPAGTVDPKLDVTAPTFEEAVVALRDAVVKHYGAVDDATHVENSSVTAMRQRSQAV